MQFMEGVRFDGHELELLVDLSDGFSGSDIRETCLRLRRKQITSRKDPGLQDAFDGLSNLATGEGESGRFLAQVRKLEPKELALALRKRNPKVYSHAAIAALLGVSKATSYRWANKGGNANVRRS